MIAGRLASSVLAALFVALAAPASAEPNRDDPAPLLDLVRDICVKPKHDIDQAITAVQNAFGMKAMGKIEKDEGVFWDAGKQPSPFGVSYLMIGALGHGKANALLAHVTGDSGTFEAGLRALAGVTLSERTVDPVSDPSLNLWSLTGRSADGALTLNFNSQIERLANGGESNAYTVQCASTAR